MRRLLIGTLALSMAILAAPSRPAAALALTVEEQGAWACCPLDLRPFGSFTGTSGGVEHRSYFIFDTTPLGGPVIGATLRLWNPVPDGAFGGYRSPDPEETLTIFDVTTPASWLANRDTLDPYSMFVDLGTGTPYGSVTVSDADEGRWVEIALNAAGVAALNARNGSRRPRIAFGSALTTLSGSIFGEYVLSQSAEDAQLLLMVPEANEAGMLAIFLGALAFARRRGG